MNDLGTNTENRPLSAKWLDAEAHPKAIKIVLLITVLAIFCKMAVTKIFDSDMLFLIASGNEIIEHGIPFNNVWTIDSSSKIVIQQWLYDIFIAYFYQRGKLIGILLFYFIQLLGCCFVLWKMFKLRNISAFRKSIYIWLVLMMGASYTMKVRPELITLTLLFAECYAFEKYRTDKKPAILLLLPIAILLEINLHAAMWIMHCAVAFIYCVAGQDVRDDKHCQKRMIVFSLLMIPMLFVNPYGLDAILYLPKSFLAGTFGYVSVAEVAKTQICSIHTIHIGIILLFIWICKKHSKLRSETIWMALMCVVFAVISMRNVLFLSLCTATVLFDVGNVDFELFTNKIEMIRKHITNFVVVILCISACILMYFPIMSILFYCNHNDIDNINEAYIHKKMHKTIIKDYSDDMHIFTGFNDGAYFEFKGFKNIYIDARPELYTAEFTEQDNILQDYAQYTSYGFDPSGHSHQKFSKEAMEEWLDKYDFKYLVVDVSAEPVLHAYLEASDMFSQVCFEKFANENELFVLYRKEQ